MKTRESTLSFKRIKDSRAQTSPLHTQLGHPLRDPAEYACEKELACIKHVQNVQTRTFSVVTTSTCLACCFTALKFGCDVSVFTDTIGRVRSIQGVRPIPECSLLSMYTNRIFA